MIWSQFFFFFQSCVPLKPRMETWVNYKAALNQNWLSSPWPWDFFLTFPRMLWPSYLETLLCSSMLWMYMYPSRHCRLWPTRTTVFFKSFMFQAVSLKLAGYCPCSFFVRKFAIKNLAISSHVEWPSLRVLNNLMGIAVITSKRNFLNDQTISLRKDFEAFIYFFICLFF